jgi:hypothetical protein
MIMMIDDEKCRWWWYSLVALQPWIGPWRPLRFHDSDTMWGYQPHDQPGSSHQGHLLAKPADT